MPPKYNSDTSEDNQREYTRWTPPQHREPRLGRFEPARIRNNVRWGEGFTKKMEKLGRNGKPQHRLGVGWNVPHIQETVEDSTDLLCVPKRLHDTRTGQVCTMSGVGGRLDYATVSHVWDMTDGEDWLQLSRRIGERLSVPYVWIDKTCINQENEGEKGQEIKKMAEYYSSARHNVIVMSGFSMAEAVGAWKEEGMGYYTPAHIHAARLAGELVGHRYFTRVWTMQEQELARNSVLLMEDGWVQGHDLDNLLRSLAETLTISGDYALGRVDMQDMFCNCQRRNGVTSAQWQRSVREPLIDVWKRAEGRRCGSPKDVLWGVISLVKGGDRLKTTYDDATSDVLAELLGQENCLGEILMIKDGVPSCQDDQLPCWQPRLTGQVPEIVAIIIRREMVPFILEKRNLGTKAYLIEEWSVGGKGAPILGGEEVDPWTSPPHWGTYRRNKWRFWFVPIWRDDDSTTGAVLADWNSEGNRIHKAMTLTTGRLSKGALALAAAKFVLIGAT